MDFYCGDFDQIGACHSRSAKEPAHYNDIEFHVILHKLQCIDFLTFSEVIH